MKLQNMTLFQAPITLHLSRPHNACLHQVPKYTYFMSVVSILAQIRSFYYTNFHSFYIGVSRYTKGSQHMFNRVVADSFALKILSTKLSSKSDANTLFDLKINNAFNMKLHNLEFRCFAYLHIPSVKETEAVEME